MLGIDEQCDALPNLESNINKMIKSKMQNEANTSDFLEVIDFDSRYIIASDLIIRLMTTKFNHLIRINLVISIDAALITALLKSGLTMDKGFPWRQFENLENLAIRFTTADSFLGEEDDHSGIICDSLLCNYMLLNLPELQNTKHLQLEFWSLSICQLQNSFSSIFLMKNLQSFSLIMNRVCQTINQDFELPEEPSSLIDTVKIEIKHGTEVNQEMPRFLSKFLKTLKNLSQLSLSLPSEYSIAFQNEFYEQADLYQRLQTLQLQIRGRLPQVIWISSIADLTKFKKLNHLSLTIFHPHISLTKLIIRAVLRNKTLEICKLNFFYHYDSDMPSPAEVRQFEKGMRNRYSSCLRWVNKRDNFELNFMNVMKIYI